MSEEIYQTDEQETLEMDEVLEKVISYCAEEAKEKLAQAGSFEPFTVVVEGDNMHIENHPGDNPEEIRSNARVAVATASSFASYYTFTYDGFVDTDAGELDAIVIEAAARDDEEAMAIVNLYRVDESGDGSIVFEDELAYVGETESWFDRAAVAAGDEAEMEAAQQALDQQQAQAKAAELLERIKSENAEGTEGAQGAQE